MFMLFLIINLLYLVDHQSCIYNFRSNTKYYYYYTIFENYFWSLHKPVSDAGEPALNNAKYNLGLKFNPRLSKFNSRLALIGF